MQSSASKPPPKAEKVRRPAELDALFVAAHQQIIFGELMRHALEREFQQLPLSSDSMVGIDVERVTMRERLERAWRVVASTMRVADISLASWADLVDVADQMQILGSQVIRMMETASPDTLHHWQEAIDASVDEKHRSVALTLAPLANFLYLAPPPVRKKAALYVPAVEVDGGGVAFVRYDNAVRDVRHVTP